MTRLDAGHRVLIDTVLTGCPSMDEALNQIQGRLQSGADAPMHVFFANPEAVNIARRNAAYRRHLNRAQLVLPEGASMHMAAKMLGGRFQHIFNRTDLLSRLCQRLEHSGQSLYLLGARPGVTEQVAAWVAFHHPGLRVAGYRNGFFDVSETEQVVNGIRASQADVLWVDMGAPLQERWIESHAAACGVKVAMGVGGFFDTVSGHAQRGPDWRRRWVGNLGFFIAIGMQRWIGSADPRNYEQEQPPAFDQPMQRAVLLADWPDTPGWLNEDDKSTALLPLGDRPVIHRILETLTAAGCTEVDLYASHSVSALRTSLGDGSRWGMVMRIHGVRDFADACSRSVRQVGAADAWLVRADHWLPAEALRDAPLHCAWMSAQPDGLVRWSGWARLPGLKWAETLQALPMPNFDGSQLADGVAQVGTREPFRLHSATEILSAQSRWLARTASPLERLAEPVAGVRVAPTARVSPGAVLIAPVEIGDNVFVGEGVRLGPNVVLGDSAYLEGTVEASNTLVCQGVVLSGDAHLNGSVVTTTGLFDQRHQIWLPAQLAGDLIGNTETEPWPLLPTPAERAVAAFLWILTVLPVSILGMFSRRMAGIQQVTQRLPKVVLGQATLVGAGRHETVPESLQYAGWGKPLTESLPALIRPSQALGIADPEAAAWADVRWLVEPTWRTRAMLGKHWLILTWSGHTGS